MRWHHYAKWLEVVSMKDKKDSMDDKSSSDNVEEYLQILGNDDDREMLYYSQEQAFSSDELSSVINEARLNELLAQSDEFLKSLGSELKDFENTTVEEVKCIGHIKDVLDLDKKKGIS